MGARARSAIRQNSPIPPPAPQQQAMDALLATPVALGNGAASSLDVLNAESAARCATEMLVGQTTDGGRH